MHIGIDIREATRSRKAGKGQWTAAFAHEVLARDEELTLFTDETLPSEWQQIIASNVRVHVHHDASKGLRWHWNTARAVKNDSSIDVYVSPTSFIVPFLLGRTKKVIPVVHDLIAFQNEPHDRKAMMIERLTLKRSMVNAHFVCVISENTKQDLLKKFPMLNATRVIPIYAAPIGESFVREAEDGSILCISTLCPRKNQKRLIEAYAALSEELKSRHPLILVGARGWHDEEIVKLAASTPGVEWKSYLSDAECRSLMARACVLAFPSLYEGFGIPIIEAMRAGVPVLTSNIGSMKEVAGDAALLIDPLNVDAIRGGLQRLLSDAELRADHSRKGLERAKVYSWQKTVDLFLEAVHHFSS